MIRVSKNCPIAEFSTFKIGGRARLFCETQNHHEFLAVIHLAEKLKIPYKILAGGSNIVFPDGILNCLLIRIKTPITRENLKITGNKIIVDAGVELMAVIKKAVSRGLGGLETLSGIPGTIGGAIIGNAGAYGHSISESVEKVEVWDGQRQRWINKKSCKFGYRHSIFKENPDVILQAVLKFKKANPGKLKEISRKIIQIRRKKYKPGLCCAGSFFKNVFVKDLSKKSLKLIDKDKIKEGKIPAGYLLEEVGAKGMKIGGIKVADFHANTLINIGKGKAKEVKKLAKILKTRVKKKFGLDLKEEVRYF